jgi:3alpha(or 20beta)-hydroxysteroid dehydrogenase
LEYCPVGAEYNVRPCGTPEEVATLMLFLAGDESRYCTGGVYMVDGGLTA